MTNGKPLSLSVYVEVRDCPRTGYLVPGRDGPGLWESLVFGPEMVSYERSRLIDRWVLREISARVFFVKNTKIDKRHIPNFSRILGIIQTSISNVSRIVEHRKNKLSNVSRI